MQTILTSKEQEIYVDDDDFDLVKQFVWRVDKWGYVVTSIHNKSKGTCFVMKMHRLIMGNVGDLNVDHINHDKLDNRKSNLRACTFHQNSMNKKIRIDSKHPYKGVYSQHKHGKTKYFARCRGSEKHVYTKGYDTIEEAALAYNAIAKDMFGEYACLNEVPQC